MPGADPKLTEAKHPTGIVIAFGGTATGNRRAQEIGWAKAIDFLRANPTGAQKTE